MVYDLKFLCTLKKLCVKVNQKIKFGYKVTTFDQSNRIIPCVHKLNVRGTI